MYLTVKAHSMLDLVHPPKNKKQNKKKKVPYSLALLELVVSLGRSAFISCLYTECQNSP